VPQRRPESLQFHGLDVAVLDLGDAGLGDAEDLSDLRLCLAQGLAEFLEVVAGYVGVKSARALA
jgi:hypothetical protein